MFNYSAFKQYLDSNGLKHKFIAQQANLTEAAFSAILTGRSNCTLNNYVTICRILNLPFGSFLDLNADNQQPNIHVVF